MEQTKGCYNMKNLALIYLAFALIVVTMPFVADAVIDKSDAFTVSVRFSDGVTEEIGIEEYVLRVLAAREGDITALEAKKAFAVAARSVGMYFATFGCKHSDFDCCDSGDCCIELASVAGASESTQNAVSETAGLYLETDNAPALALFTLCASSGTVQSDEFDYLVSVDSNVRCERHVTEIDFTDGEILDIFPEARDDMKFYAVYGESNKLSFAIVGGKQIDGAVISTALGLKSKEITITPTENGIKAISYGVGHGMGLDLCNSERLALDGVYYKKILEFYFPRLNLKGN